MATYPIFDRMTHRMITTAQLDEHVRSIVETLIEAGAETMFSCDGHGDPIAFYVVFRSPYKLARHIAQAGFFEITISRSYPDKGGDHWHLSLGASQIRGLNRDYREAMQEWLADWRRAVLSLE